MRISALCVFWWIKVTSAGYIFLGSFRNPASRLLYDVTLLRDVLQYLQDSRLLFNQPMHDRVCSNSGHCTTMAERNQLAARCWRLQIACTRSWKATKRLHNFVISASPQAQRGHAASSAPNNYYAVDCRIFVTGQPVYRRIKKYNTQSPSTIQHLVMYIFNKSKRARGHLHCSTVKEHK